MTAAMELSLGDGADSPCDVNVFSFFLFPIDKSHLDSLIPLELRRRWRRRPSVGTVFLGDGASSRAATTASSCGGDDAGSSALGQPRLFCLPPPSIAGRVAVRRLRRVCLHSRCYRTFMQFSVAPSTVLSEAARLLFTSFAQQYRPHQKHAHEFRPSDYKRRDKATL